MLVIFCTMGLAGSGISVYLPYISKHADLNGTQSSSIITIRSFFALFGVFFVQKYYSKFGSRVGGTLAVAGVSAGYVLFAIARGYTVYCLGAAVMGISYGIGGMYLASTLMPKWFKSYVSAAVGICAAGTGVNSIIAPPIITAAIARWGLPAACWLEAAFILLIALIVFSMMRDRPSDFGLSPYETSQSKPDGKKQKLHLLRMATKQEQFMMIIAVTLMHGSIAAAYYHFSLLFTTLGFSNMQIARFLSITGITLTFGKFICGLMADI